MSKSKKKFEFDPDKLHDDGPTNGTVANWALAGLDGFLKATGESAGTYEDAVRDLMADLLHFCDREGIDGVLAMKRAKHDWRMER